MQGREDKVHLDEELWMCLCQAVQGLWWWKALNAAVAMTGWLVTMAVV